MKKILLIIIIVVVGFVVYAANTLPFGNSWI